MDRDKIETEAFKKWVDFAKERGMGLDFNPTLFSHRMVKDNLTLSARTKCQGISDRPLQSLYPDFGIFCYGARYAVPLMNILIPDGC